MYATASVKARHNCKTKLLATTLTTMVHGRELKNGPPTPENLRYSHKNQFRPISRQFVDLGVQNVCHVAQNGEDKKTDLECSSEKGPFNNFNSPRLGNIV